MRHITHIKASNLLSFGPDGLNLELRDLNVLIGPNASGKSNFLEIFELLKALPRGEEDSQNVERVIIQGGGFDEWRWKGAKDEYILLEVTIADRLNKVDWAHGFKLTNFFRFEIENEYITNKTYEAEKRIPQFLLKYEYPKFMVWTMTGTKSEFATNSPLSVLSQNVPTASFIKHLYERIRLYREWSFGRNTVFRTPQRADLRNDRLESDFSNLGVVLSRLRKNPEVKRSLINALRDLYEGLTDFEIIVEGGFVQVLFQEGDFSIPATRLSDGTLHYLCLLAILLDPTPPPIVCIEEPELGLHPDLLPKLADLLVDASTRTQLIVTTHSDILIDALSDRPESVLVCEKQDGQTHMKRLEKSEIDHWLNDYRLGQLWTRGEIGGTRW